MSEEIVETITVLDKVKEKIGDKANTLTGDNYAVIAYKGGGYDGCFWEWNYSTVQSNGDVEHVVSSGYKGCKNDEDLIERLEDDETDIYVVPTDWDKFLDKESITSCIMVAKKLHLYMYCSICGEKMYDDDINPEDYKGCGGISYLPQSAICGDCENDHTCRYCGTFYDEDDALDDEGYCEYCQKRK